jgi:branched-chain amino acid transport system permease protein
VNPLLLRCENLEKSFGGVRALSNVSITFPPTGCIAIIGPNGAGKSTLFNVITGFTSADGGSCFLGMECINSLRPDQIVRRGIVRTFQQVRLIGRLSAVENIMLALPNQAGENLWRALLPIGLHDERAKQVVRARELLDNVALAEYEDAPAAALSYGQQKLLSIACCMAASGAILLLDEPFAGVNPTVAERVSELIRAIVQAQKLVIFVEHDMEMVRRTADEVLLMNCGEIVARGPPKDLLDRPELLEAYVT